MSEHSALIVIILTMVLLIFYYCASEVNEHSFENKLHTVYEETEQTTLEDAFDNTTKKRVKIQEDISENCDQLYGIARDMLLGDKIKLPFQTKHTQWKFHERGNLDELNRTSLVWNFRYPLSTNNTNFKLMLSNSYRKVLARDIKVKKYFITFANNCCKKSKIKAVNSARYPGGFDFTTVHDMSSLSPRFQRSHSYILHQKRGSGFWLWKPYIILKTLVDNMANGDLMMYQDAGAYLIGDAGPLLKMCKDVERGILVFDTQWMEGKLSKRDALILLNMDDGRVYETRQRLASFLVLQRSCESLQFVMEWLAYASDSRILTDMDNEMGKENLPGFMGNRHDQTVLSLLSKKWELPAFTDPSQFGNKNRKHKNSADPYGQLIRHSRDKS